MHSLAIVMVQDFTDIEAILTPYSDELMSTFRYEECFCVDSNSVPNPKCPYCRGTGKRGTAYNDNGHWDWYEDIQAEGRWPEYVIPMSPVEVTPQGLPFIIVTPSKGWLERGQGDEASILWAPIYWAAFDEAIAEGYRPFVVDVHD